MTERSSAQLRRQSAAAARWGWHTLYVGGPAGRRATSRCVDVPVGQGGAGVGRRAERPGGPKVPAGVVDVLCRSALRADEAVAADPRGHGPRRRRQDPSAERW